MNRAQRLVCLYLMGKDMRNTFDRDEARYELELFLHQPEVWRTMYVHDGHAPGTDAGIDQEFQFPETQEDLEEMFSAIRREQR